jgi:repressor LexA
VLTQRQLQLLQYIQTYLDEHGVPPSFEEMRRAMKLKSKSGIHRMLAGLEERGFIRRLAYRARALEVVRAGINERAAPVPLARAEPAAPRRSGFLSGVAGTRELPVYGRIAAGTPIEALVDHGTTLDVPSVLLGEGEHFVLQVTGDSMIGVGIHDGDWVVVRRGETAENGEIVVALVEDREVTLKRLRRRGASIALEAANPNHETRIFGPHQVRVQGRLVGLVRRY